AAEGGMKVPSEPVIFTKATSAICGPNDDIEIPRGGTKTDWEVELGVVIGTPAKYVAEADAMSYVAGYCVINDLSERAFQLEGTGQWVKGKSADTFGPIGPWLVTADEVTDPQNLKMWLEVDGHRYQNGSTRTMIFGVRRLVSYVNRFMSLQPGDIISTGSGYGAASPGLSESRKPDAAGHRRVRRAKPTRDRGCLSCALANPMERSNKISMAEKVGFESAHQRSFNNLDRGRWRLTRIVRCNSLRTAGKRHGDRNATSPLV